MTEVDVDEGLQCRVAAEARCVHLQTAAEVSADRTWKIEFDNDDEGNSGRCDDGCAALTIVYSAGSAPRSTVLHKPGSANEMEQSAADRPIQEDARFHYSWTNAGNQPNAVVAGRFVAAAQVFCSAS